MSSLNKSYPKVIRKLDETVVNRISAGEVIHRPVNVVKELIENSLDANCSSIEVTIKDGGMKTLIIQDNGCGIQKEDLDIVCERFTTSKLESFEDLVTIQTHGFRGEALASISHISYVTIVTKTDSQMCGFKIQFIDGKPKSDAVPLAANNGTIITVENLFYNIPLRRKALNNISHEYNLIIDLLTKYAINYSNRVSFSLKKLGESCDLVTNVDNSLIDNIRVLYGPNIATNLIEISFEDMTRLKFLMTGFTSNQNIHQKNFVFILFINNRLVECQTLKKAIDLIYSNYLLKSCHPFVYLDIKIESHNIDVNVHPTKNEVYFLHEQEICEKIVETIESKLTKGKESRLLSEDISTLFNMSSSQLSIESQSESQSMSRNNASVAEVNKSPKIVNINKEITSRRPQKQVRTDSKDRKINEYLFQSKKVNRKRRDIRLKSVILLRNNVSEETDSNFQNIICNSTFVGCADETYILVQYNTQLFLVNAVNLNIDLFYQLYLIDFANFEQIKFAKPLLISEIIAPYLNDLNNNSQTQPLDAIFVETILMEKSEMLSDYFSINISPQKELLSLPQILDSYVPNFGYLPQFLCCLAQDVNWKSEKECFESIGKILANFYAKPPNKFESNDEHHKWAKMFETLIYPKYKQMLCPSKSVSNNSTFFAVTTLPDLYKVFERC